MRTRLLRSQLASVADNDLKGPRFDPKAIIPGPERGACCIVYISHDKFEVLFEVAYGCVVYSLNTTVRDYCCYSATFSRAHRNLFACDYLKEHPLTKSEFKTVWDSIDSETKKVRTCFMTCRKHTQVKLEIQGSQQTEEAGCPPCLCNSPDANRRVVYLNGVLHPVLVP